MSVKKSAIEGMIAEMEKEMMRKRRCAKSGDHRVEDWRKRERTKSRKKVKKSWSCGKACRRSG